MNTFHLAKKLKEVVGSFSHDCPITFSDETKLLGSGGGLWNARQHFRGQGDFVLMNGDEIIIPLQSGQLEKARAHHVASGAMATLLVTEHEGVGSQFGGVWVDKKSKILGFGKQKAAGSEKGFHYIGAGIFSDKIFDFLPEGESNILYDALMASINAGQTATVFPFHCHWFETGNEADFKSASKECMSILSEHNPESKYLFDILHWRAPNSMYTANKEVQVLSDVSVTYDMTKLYGYNIFAEGVVLNKKCELKNCILGPRVEIKNADRLEDKLYVNEQDVF